jgi:phospholipase C
LNNPNQVDPFRLDRSESLLNDNNHEYIDEQKKYNGGKLNKFVENNDFAPNFLAQNQCPANVPKHSDPTICFNPKQVMGYYDGNTVTAIWNYAQHFAMSDNHFQTHYGESTPGHINLISGQTHGVIPENANAQNPNPNITITYTARGTIIGDPDPKYDDCSLSKEDTLIVPYIYRPEDAESAGEFNHEFNVADEELQQTSDITDGTVVKDAFKPKVEMTGKNVGNLLNDKGVTWGWFSAGFKPTPNNSTVDNCSGITHTAFFNETYGVTTHDYYASVEPFRFYESTANPNHLRPSSVEMIGHTDQANHQYDLSDFWDAAESGNLPAVSFLKAPSYQDAHSGFSGPLLEQTFLVNTINQIQKLPEWDSTAVIVAYDDSDGWYDHVFPPLVSESSDPEFDALFGPRRLCGDPPEDAYQLRCGYGPRLPLLVISPYAKVNYVDHHVTDQTSILRFIEDNWNLTYWRPIT